ncbi:hypothetical protein LDENG_00017030 [Lucifuga dentata]|nr:hypothetical protein LDENG_00017030 [Lucifuga dentata]
MSLTPGVKEAHERELEGWQVRVQELSNKKGCDTKRMEELFTRNQQMKEQQRVLTENIKTLENRLRAGLCDRCTVTQEVAKRRQQEYDASQMQSLQHISILAGELNNLRKENKRLKEEVRSLRAALEGHSEQSSNSTTTEVKLNSSPDLSPLAGPVALVTTATSRATNQPADGNAAVKAEPDQTTTGGETEHKHTRGWNRSHFESYKPISASGSWKIENIVRGNAGERRTQTVEGPDQRSSLHSQSVLLKTSSLSSSSPSSSSSNSGEVNSIHHVLHVPVPCRPHPIKRSPVTLPWSLSEASDWVTLAASTGNSLMLQANPKPNLLRFPSQMPTNQQANHCSPRRQIFGHPWPKQSPPQPSSKEPTVVLRLKSVVEQRESQAKAQEKRETPPSKPEVIGEGLKEVFDGPLDLSDRGRSKSNQNPKNDAPSVLQDGARVEERPDKDRKTDSSAHTLVSSPSSLVIPSSSSTSPANQDEEEYSSDQDHKQLNKEQEQKEEMNGKKEQTNEKKVPVLTISLRPVVVLETLNSALQKQESLSSNGKASSPTDEPESSSEEQEEESSSGQESMQGSKRKRASVETDTERDSDIDNIQQERKIKIMLRPETKSSS